MNKLRQFLLLQLICVFLFSCDFTAKKNNSNYSNIHEKVKLVINPYAYNEARSAIPEINWDDYSYELKSIQNPGEATQKAEETLVSGRSRNDLGVGISIDLGKYKFTLNAYKNGVKVLSGSVTKDLTTGGNAVLNFKMYPVSGSSGSAEISVTYPLVNSVAQIKGAVTRDLFVNPEEIAAETIEAVTVSGEKKAVYARTGLPSNTEQYAHLWFYDEAGKVIYTMLESLVIVGGSHSSCERRLTDADWRTYACAITLKKDGEAWSSSGKSVALVDKMMPSIRYGLKDIGNGVFSSNAAEGEYYVYVNNENTYAEFRSSSERAEVEYYSVKAAEAKGCTITAVSGAVESDGITAVVQSGNNFVYKVEKKEGYEKSGAGLSVKINGSAVADADFDRPLTIENINESKTISVSGIEAIEYTISYSFAGNNASWKNGYTAPAVFTAEETVILPAVANITGDGKLFDVWVDAADGKTVYKTTEGIYRNLNLKATWKDSASVKVINGQGYIYANGLSLIIEANGSATNVYIDLEGNGVIDEDDYQLEATDGNRDFTDYILSAGTEDGKEIKSDFKFTMTGGQIRAVLGLDSKDVKRSNKSILNLSGNAKIGKASGVVINKDEEGNSYTTAAKVEGVMLETISDEIINIKGALSSESYIYCVTPYAYEEGSDRFIAYIGNSTWANYDYFACYTDDTENSGVYKKNKLTMKSRKENGVQKTIIRLADPAGIALPKPDEIDGDVNIGFSLGDDRVSSECSVFSLAVENGVFYMEERTTFTPNTPDGQQKLELSADECSAIEATLTYMAQPTETTYVESLAFKDSETNEVQTYVYMHILSAGNQITPEIASDFLAQIKFRRTGDKEVKIKVNLETVPSTDIAENNVVYFNGSFYKRLPTVSPSNWSVSYNAAKQTKFNNLKGYLMNITSLVENNYIYEIFGKNGREMTYIGGARLYPTEGKFDQTTYSYQKGPYNGVDYGTNGFDGTYWYWQAGPEAGTPFWNGKTVSSSTVLTGRMPDPVNGGYMYTRWNNKLFNNGSVGAEPNNSSSNEYVIQYLADGNNNGFWNDQPLQNTSKDYASKSYIVEYTPYENEWNIEEAQYQSITRTASY
ncbi:MAG: hypothetical protein MJ174_07795 [Treponema sp.]|nr:hypothetical protein [Treponema sp.]